MGRVTEASIRPGDLGGAMPILGTGGADALGGTDGRDVVDALAGDDTLGSGAGNDRMMGGYGNDGLLLEAGDDWLDGGPGEDWVAVAGAEAARVDLANDWGSQDTGFGRDSLRGIEHASGGAGADRLSGTEGTNRLEGHDGDDLLEGRAGADTLVGGQGRDVLSGGDDWDRDVFAFEDVSQSAAGPGRDVVQGFVSGIDDLYLRDIDANPGVAGDQAFAWGGTTAGAHRAWVGASGSDAVLVADVTGDGVADLEVRIEGLTSLSSSDVLL